MKLVMIFRKSKNYVYQFIESLNHTSTATGTINLNYLLEKSVIQIEGNRIISLDTTLIGEHLWLNHETVEQLHTLKKLTLCNVMFSELDCSKLPELEYIRYISCMRNGLALHIGKNDKLKTFDASNAKLEDKEVKTLSLCAHPDQVGSVFSSDIEHENKDGYLMIRLALAPSKAQHNIVADELPDKFLWQYEDADLRQVLAAYWRLQPEYYTQYATLGDAPALETETFKLLLEIEEKVTQGFYKNKNVPFDINDFDYMTLSDREFHDARQIPQALFEKIV